MSIDPHDFNPQLRNISGNMWEASARLQVVGDVSVVGNGWPDAKIKLWLIAVALEMLEAKSTKPPSDFTNEEWKVVMKTLEKLS